LEGHPNAILFQTFDDLKTKLQDSKNVSTREIDFFEKNNLYARFQSIGVNIK
jgi:hypothetical protein